MSDLEQEWLNFTEYNEQVNKSDENEEKCSIIPECSDIYISTKTKIGYLNSTVDIFNVFWKLPILDYHFPQEGIIKKTVKTNCETEEESNQLDKLIENEIDINKQVDVYTINKNTNKNEGKYKDVRKVTVGLSKKDLLNHRKKKKSAFYNCFAIIYRILFNNEFREVHVKVFNTGKLEIPGIQDDNMMIYALEKLCSLMTEITQIPVTYNKTDIQNVLINSNFKCNYYINRDKLFNILKYKYNIHSLFDACSYPGIQCKYYENSNNNGICTCSTKCGFREKSNVKKSKLKCVEVSFMIFRTGSILIVGHCNEDVLHKVYMFVKKMLLAEFKEIHIPIENPLYKTKKKKKKLKKKTIMVKINK
jgi:TATA-box binding protein (TBP) (component of TFIID and TFIIIB)|tara:strand:- start:40 stop:1125 length:1086 start_codon:yes stop_codon:yes gene_type:complete